MGRICLNMAAVEVRAPASQEEWQAYFELRWQLLRAPWQQPRGSERDEYENTAVHRMICDEDNRILAVGRLHRVATSTGQIRFMAVAESCRRQGLGRRLLESLESAARDGGRSEIIVQARESSVRFYENAGYRLVAKSHRLFNEIQHFKMHKVLSGSQG
ncbi:MAG: GNAT family N-acetyltransferase [Thiogranum sp.]|nr:GNAT family N-acetyltransferase [Thiogranum sp.]